MEYEIEVLKLESRVDLRRFEAERKFSEKFQFPIQILMRVVEFPILQPFSNWKLKTFYSLEFVWQEEKLSMKPKKQKPIQKFVWYNAARDEEDWNCFAFMYGEPQNEIWKFLKLGSVTMEEIILFWKAKNTVMCICAICLGFLSRQETRNQ